MNAGPSSQHGLGNGNIDAVRGSAEGWGITGGYKKKVWLAVALYALLPHATKCMSAKHIKHLYTFLTSDTDTYYSDTTCTYQSRQGKTCVEDISEIPRYYKEELERSVDNRNPDYLWIGRFSTYKSLARRRDQATNLRFLDCLPGIEGPELNWGAEDTSHADRS